MSDAVLVSDSGLRDLSEQAVRYMIEELGAERAVVLLDEGEPEFSVLASQGLNREGFWLTAPLSISVLEDVIESGEPLVTADAQRDHGELFSLQVSEIKSLLCVPLFRTLEGRDKVVSGLLYADLRLSRNVFRRTELEKLKQFARRFQRIVFEDPDSSLTPPKPKRQGVAKLPNFQVKRQATKQAERPSARSGAKPKGAKQRQAPARFSGISRLQRAVFFRSLCTMVGAGIPIHYTLECLARGSENPELARACEYCSGVVQDGHRLSEAFEKCTGAFDEMHIRMIRVAETTGALPAILDRLASYEEWTSGLEQKLRSALTYPALVGSFSLLLLMLVPPFILKPQFELIKQLGGEMPLLTQILMTVSGPVSLVPVFLFFGMVYWLSVQWRVPSKRATMYRTLLRVPAVGRVLLISSLSRFSRTLSMQLDSGVLISQALPLAAGASGNPLLNDEMEKAVAALLNGDTFSESLENVEVFPETFLQIVVAGEQTASLPDMLKWLAGFFDQELEASLDAYASLFEPIMLLIVGLIVGILSLGTLLPVVRVLQSAL